MSSYIVGGVSYINIAGTYFDCKQEITYQPVTFDNEYVPNWSGTLPYTQTPKAGEVTVTLINDGSFTIGSLAAMTNIPVIVGMATGAQVILNNAVYRTSGDFDVKEGTFSITYMSTNIIEIPA